ncbi:MAG TPA: glycosyltransferase [Pirellulales bacterium]|nr:glycosyltransferase [Pirellulales bacterium]
MISFIIPAHNEERLLGRTLQALQGAAESVDEPFEVIVVDDASTDSTAAVAAGQGARVVAASHHEIAAARNAGASVAKGELFIFVDADTSVTADAVGAAVRAMRQGAVGGGCAFTFDGRLPLYGRLLTAVSVPLYRILGLASGCFLFCTRDAFEAVAGFDEGLFAAEEAVMSRRLRARGRFVVLREMVTTSGRKLRTHSAREIVGVLMRFALHGLKAARQREGLDLWYGERRADPEGRDAPVR